MFVLLTGADSYTQFITVLVVFVLVLAITAVVTKWAANYQRGQSVNRNLEVMETARLGSNKWLQIVRAGDTFVAIAVCKDTVTLLGEIPKEQLKEISSGGGELSFRELFDRTIRRNSSDDKGPKD